MSDYIEFKVDMTSSTTSKDIEKLFSDLDEKFIDDPNNPTPIRLVIKLPDDLKEVPEEVINLLKHKISKCIGFTEMDIVSKDNPADQLHEDIIKHTLYCNERNMIWLH